MTTYLLKLGELTLKGGNREEFEHILRRNILSILKGTEAIINTTNGRFFVRCSEEMEKTVEQALDRVIGITGWAKARVCEKTKEKVIASCVAEAKVLAASGKKSFKIEARRADKSFPLDSYAIMREAGAAVIEAVPTLSVDVKKPECVIEVEIRERAYIYGAEHQGCRGLPVGSAGRGLLLLSGGIDSPVAGYMMARRGMRIDAVYFHAYPYTSREAQEKVVQLASTIGRYSLGVRLTTIPFTKTQLRIKEKAPEAWTTVLLRMAMMDVADRLARMIKAKCLITGESLSQVASQTIENMTCTESRAKFPVMRPLIGVDKQDTVSLAQQIGTYEISILPYEDCCVLFSPKHPILRADLREATELYESLELIPLIEEAIRDRTIQKCGTSII